LGAGVEAAEADLAGVGGAQAHETLYGGGFAGAVGAEQAEDLSGGDLEVYRAHGRFAGVGLA
jgi:hypothetical protein